VRRQPFGFRPDNSDEQNEIRALRESVETALKRAFRPEFLNRIDDTIVFHPLTQKQIIEIVELMIRDVQRRPEEREITFELTSDAEHWLAKEGFDPVYGVRPLPRAIQRQVENPLARMVLSGEV
jgi:ATP-dependent Clp protease ATP-binding subunit ClpC